MTLNEAARTLADWKTAYPRWVRMTDPRLDRYLTARFVRRCSSNLPNYKLCDVLA